MTIHRQSPVLQALLARENRCNNYYGNFAFSTLGTFPPMSRAQPLGPNVHSPIVA